MIARVPTHSAMKLRDWAIQQALPLWATAGFDARTGQFYESLTSRGSPNVDKPTRLIVQARQIYCFALAARRGWYPGSADIVERAYAAMVRDYHGPDGQQGWVYSRFIDGRVEDERRDLYSHAFALLAISSYVSITNRSEAKALASTTLEFLDRKMEAPTAGGYIEALPLNGPRRRQNPHMHMLEAMLSLWSSTGEAGYLGRAGEMFGLFSSRFFRANGGIVGEYFNSSLEPEEGPGGELVEPGHLCEWIWLLRWFQRETGRMVQPYVDALYAHASKHGYDGAGLMVDEVRVDGIQLTPSHRVWPMTEAIKANIAEALQGRTGAALRASELMNLVYERFLRDAPPGGWTDRLDASGCPVPGDIPASTFYHLLCAIDESQRGASIWPVDR